MPIINLRYTEDEIDQDQTPSPTCDPQLFEGRGAGPFLAFVISFRDFGLCQES